MLKSKLREKIIKIRDKVYKKSFQIDFHQILKIIKNEKITSKIIGGYYPVNSEMDDLDLLKRFENKNYIISLPKLKKNYQMDFFEWSTRDPLMINQYGIPEPISNKIKYPDVILVPLVAFDKNFNRIGYGGGYYDRYIKRMKKNKKIITIGLAYSFQKVKEISTNEHDVRLDFVITDK